MTARAVVFGYHDVGDRCLRVLVSQGVEVPLVVTHTPDPAETQWFASVESTAREYGIPVLTPENPEQAGLERIVQTPYVNTIPLAQQSPLPGNPELEARLRHYIRWNAMAIPTNIRRRCNSWQTIAIWR